MIRDRTALYLWVALALSGVMLGEVGCAKKQLSSGSEEQSMTSKGQPPTEAIQADRIASIEPPANGGESGIPAARSNQLPATTPGNDRLQSISAPLSEKGSVKASDTIGIGDIYFDFDQYNIRADAQPVLERNGQWMRNASGKSLLIEGHCDERGTLAYNLVLGEKRAKSAKRYLENLGIPSSRLHTTSYGEVKPSCKEHNEGCWKYNRRAHFVVQ